jgi:hypothetical protein
MTLALIETTSIEVVPFTDPVVDRLGYDPRSAYVESFWLPILGPSTTWFLRLVAARLAASPGRVTLEVTETARQLGLGDANGPHAAFGRTVKRCVDFDMASWRDPTQLAVRTKLPPLARRHLLRLTPGLRERHEQFLLAAAKPTAGVERLRTQGRQLALSLLELGEDEQAAEQQLLRWRYHPALARECAHWASAEWGRRRAPLSGVPRS